MQNKKGIPYPCTKDCVNRCEGCRLECKKYSMYEKLKKYEENKKKAELKYKENIIYINHKDIFADYAVKSRRNRKNMFKYV